MQDLPKKAVNLRLGELLREARIRNGLTLAEVERRSSGRIKARALGSYERGSRPVPALVLAELGQIYEIDTAKLLIQVQRDD